MHNYMFVQVLLPTVLLIIMLQPRNVCLFSKRQQMNVCVNCIWHSWHSSELYIIYL